MQAKEVSRRELTVRKIAMQVTGKSLGRSLSETEKSQDDHHGELTAHYAVFSGQLQHTLCTGICKASIRPNLLSSWWEWA
jgi:hypothetical protein